MRLNEEIRKKLIGLLYFRPFVILELRCLHVLYVGEGGGGCLLIALGFP